MKAILWIALLAGALAWAAWEEAEELSQLGCITDTQCMAYGEIEQ